MPEQPDYRLTVRPIGPADPPPAIRLRRFLKLALRGFGLKCIDVEEVTPTAKVTGAAVPEDESQPVRKRSGL